VVNAIGSSIAASSGLAQGLATVSATTSGYVPDVLGSIVGRTRQAFGIRESRQTATRTNVQRARR
jgi:hypothetical protein